MQSLILFLSLAVFPLAGYLFWPSRYNIVTHINVGFAFIAFFVPIVILQYQDFYPADLVKQFTTIVAIGAVTYIVGMYLGFKLFKLRLTKLSFDVMDQHTYEKRVVSITKILLYFCVCGLTLSYAIMGFIPMFAADPLAAKFFRGIYQAPYMRVAVLYRLCFFILSTIVPIAIVVGYHFKERFVILVTLLGIGLMLVSLSRGPAFSGILVATTIIMSFKSKFHFRLVIILIFSSYLLSAFFYAIAGIVTSDDNTATTFWSSIAQSAPDFTDGLYFLEQLNKNMKWTYGKTIFGSFIPGHYEWNPAVYTLQVITGGSDVDDVVSGGIRVPLPFWGYVSFQWIGIVIFCIFTGFLNGVFLKYTKYWTLRYSSIIIRAIIVMIYLTIFLNVSAFYSLAIYYAIPPIMVLSIYMYRFKFK